MNTVIDWYMGNVNCFPVWTQYEVFHDNEIDLITDLSEHLFPVEQGQINNMNEIERIRASQIRWVTSREESLQWAFQRITANVLHVNNLNYYLPLLGLEMLQYTVYDSSVDQAFYGRHTDVNRFNPLCVSRTRQLSFSIQLSNPNEYSGGELLIDTGDEVVMAPKDKGSMTFFLSESPHEVTPVTSGIRKCLVGWVHRP